MIKEQLKYIFQLYAANCAAVYTPHDFFTTQRFTKLRVEEVISPNDDVLRAQEFKHTTWFEARRRDNDMFEIVRCEEMTPRKGVLDQEYYSEEKYKPKNSDVALFPQKNVEAVLRKLEEQFIASKIWSVAKRQPYRATFYNHPKSKL